MKIQKSNNPLAVGALLCVLALVLGRTVWLVTRGDGDAQMVTAVPTGPKTADVPPSGAPTAATPASVPQGSTAKIAVAPVPKSARNPFVSRAARPAASRPTADGAVEQKPTEPPPSRAVQAAEVRPLSPLPVGLVPIPQTNGRPRPQTVPVVPSPIPAPKTDPLLNIRLTAVVGGAQRMAVLQTTDAQPVVVHEGDLVQGLHVAAIHDHDVVFARGDKSWTLPLQSADTTATVISDAAPTTQENADAPQ